MLLLSRFRCAISLIIVKLLFSSKCHSMRFDSSLVLSLPFSRTTELYAIQDETKSVAMAMTKFRRVILISLVEKVNVTREKKEAQRIGNIKETNIVYYIVFNLEFMKISILITKQ